MSERDAEPPRMWRAAIFLSLWVATLVTSAWVAQAYFLIVVIVGVTIVCGTYIAYDLYRRQRCPHPEIEILDVVGVRIRRCRQCDRYLHLTQQQWGNRVGILMIPEIKAAWGQRLLSGEDRQGRWVLEDAEGCVCCLGILCRLAWKAGIVERIAPTDGSPILYRGLDTTAVWHGSITYLPAVVAAWARLPSIPMVDVYGFSLSLSGVNDAGWSFPDIWDLINTQF